MRPLIEDGDDPVTPTLADHGVQPAGRIWSNRSAVIAKRPAEGAASATSSVNGMPIAVASRAMAVAARRRRSATS